MPGDRITEFSEKLKRFIEESNWIFAKPKHYESLAKRNEGLTKGMERLTTRRKCLTMRYEMQVRVTQLGVNNAGDLSGVAITKFGDWAMIGNDFEAKGSG